VTFSSGLFFYCEVSVLLVKYGFRVTLVFTPLLGLYDSNNRNLALYWWRHWTYLKKLNPEEETCLLEHLYATQQDMFAERE